MAFFFKQCKPISTMEFWISWSLTFADVTHQIHKSQDFFQRFSKGRYHLFESSTSRVLCVWLKAYFKFSFPYPLIRAKISIFFSYSICCLRRFRITCIFVSLPLIQEKYQSMMVKEKRFEQIMVMILIYLKYLYFDMIKFVLYNKTET